MPFLSTRTLERSGQRGGVEESDGRQVCLLGFSHTMNQVKVSAAPTGRAFGRRIDFSEQKRHRQKLSIRYARQRSDPGAVGFWTGLTDHFDFFGHQLVKLNFHLFICDLTTGFIDQLRKSNYWKCILRFTHGCDLILDDNRGHRPQGFDECGGHRLKEPIRYERWYHFKLVLRGVLGPPWSVQDLMSVL